MLDHAQTDDDTLLVGLRAGDPAAQRRWVTDYRPRMLATARRILSNDDDAADAVQDAFLSAFRALERFDARARFSTWLHRITINACLMKLRSRKRRHEQPIDDLLPTFLPDGHQTRDTPAWPSLSSSVEDAPSAFAPDLAEIIRLRINELPESYRIMLLLRDVEQLSTDEAAAAVEVSPAAAKVRLHRARQALRTLVERSMLAKEPTP